MGFLVSYYVLFFDRVGLFILFVISLGVLKDVLCKFFVNFLKMFLTWMSGLTFRSVFGNVESLFFFLSFFWEICGTSLGYRWCIPFIYS